MLLLRPGVTSAKRNLGSHCAARVSTGFRSRFHHHSCCPRSPHCVLGARNADPSTRPSPPVGGRDPEGVASDGVFAFLEGAVGDLARFGAVVVQAADMAPVDLVGVDAEVISAEAVSRASIASISDFAARKESRALELSVAPRVIGVAPGLSCIVSPE